jgi:hypothetical protein
MAGVPPTVLAAVFPGFWRRPFLQQLRSPCLHEVERRSLAQCGEGNGLDGEGWDGFHVTEPSSASLNRSKLKTADPEREVEPCLALYRQRLQDERALGAAN